MVSLKKQDIPVIPTEEHILTPNEIDVIEYDRYFAILPHFAIRPFTIETAYQTILESYNLSGKAVHILIMSPDHFEKKSNNLTQTIIDKPLCFQNKCLDIYSIFVEHPDDVPEKWIQEHGR